MNNRCNSVIQVFFWIMNSRRNKAVDTEMSVWKRISMLLCKPPIGDPGRRDSDPHVCTKCKMKSKQNFYKAESTQTSTWLLTEEKDNISHKNDKNDKKKQKKVKPWSRLNNIQKIIRVSGIAGRIVLLFGILYFFICALGLLEDAFKMLGGRAAGEAFQNSDLLNNPIAGLMIGVLATVLVQSSSTATSIVVAMVASQVIPRRTAIPIIMGTNIGTSVTSTLVSLAQAGEREEFRRAFAGATVHDMFNWSAVIILLPLEIITGYLYYLTGAIVDSMNLESEDYKVELLTALTRPFTELIIEVNRDVITDIAMAPNATGESSVLKRWCKVTVLSRQVAVMHYEPVKCSEVDRTSPLYSACTQPGITTLVKSALGEYGVFFGVNSTETVNTTIDKSRCPNLFAQTDLSDKAAGAILLILSILVILTSLLGIVKVLNAMLQGPVAKLIHKTVNADFPGKWSWLTGYVAILVGCGLTIIIQSSSVFTSTLTPLVGVGIVTVERMYPMALGSNIGTTVTGILAAMSTQGGHLAEALQIALCHLFFNISALLIFFPIPFMRFPIKFAKILGKITSKYRWFAIFYLVFMFLVIPAIVFALSYAGWVYLALIGGPAFLIFLFAIIVNVLQVKKPHLLPEILKNWDFLPRFLHSCAPYDRLLSCSYIKGKCPKLDSDSESDSEDDTSDNGLKEICTVKSHKYLLENKYDDYDQKFVRNSRDGKTDDQDNHRVNRASSSSSNQTFGRRVDIRGDNRMIVGSRTSRNDRRRRSLERRQNPRLRRDDELYSLGSKGSSEERRSQNGDDGNGSHGSRDYRSDRSYSGEEQLSIGSHRRTRQEGNRESVQDDNYGDRCDDRIPYVRNRANRYRSRSRSRSQSMEVDDSHGDRYDDRLPYVRNRANRSRSRSRSISQSMEVLAADNIIGGNYDNKRPYVRNRPNRSRSSSRSRSQSTELLDADDNIGGSYENRRPYVRNRPNRSRSKSRSRSTDWLADSGNERKQSPLSNSRDEDERNIRKNLDGDHSTEMHGLRDNNNIQRPNGFTRRNRDEISSPSTSMSSGRNDLDTRGNNKRREDIYLLPSGQKSSSKSESIV